MKSSILVSCCLAASAFAGALATGSTAKVDVHAHFVPDFYAQALRDAGHTPGPDGMPAIPVSPSPTMRVLLFLTRLPGLDS